MDSCCQQPGFPYGSDGCTCCSGCTCCCSYCFCYNFPPNNPCGDSLYRPAPPPEQEECRDRKLLQKQGIFPVPRREDNDCEPRRKPQFKTYWRPPAFVYPNVPLIQVSEDCSGPFRSSLCQTEERQGKIVRETLWMMESRSYDRNRGPVLRIQGLSTTVRLTYKEYVRLDKDMKPPVFSRGCIKPHDRDSGDISLDSYFVGANTKPLEDYSVFYPVVEDLFVSEELPPFSTTIMCKQVHCIKMKNEGTTAIRYMWLRAPPTRAMRKILAHPGSILNIKKLALPQDEPFFWKEDSVEFHFRQLPGVILPGQKMKFPIIFRPRRKGFFKENLYLLTHPRLTDENDYCCELQVSGICMDSDCPLPHSKGAQFVKPECQVPVDIEKMIRTKLLINEAADALHRLFDKSLYSLDTNDFKSTLPNGRVTVPQIFYTHNCYLHYRFGYAERALELVRELVRKLVPKDKIMDNEKVCPLSIQSMYNLLLRNPPATNYFWNNFKSPDTENKLEELAEMTHKLIKPRAFSWPNISTRMYSAVYATVVATIDEIFAKISNIDQDLDNEDLDTVLRAEIRTRLGKHKLRQMRRRKRHEDRRRAKEEEKQRELENEEDEEELEFPLSKTASKEEVVDILAQGDTFFQDDDKKKMEERKASQGEGGGRYMDSRGEEFEGESIPPSPPPPPPTSFLPDIPEEEIEHHLEQIRTSRETQSKYMLLETLIEFLIERVTCVCDSYKAMYDYCEFKAIRPCVKTTECSQSQD